MRWSGSNRPGMRVIWNERNLGFGAALNQASRSSQAVYLATLNDDAAADPKWLEALVAEADAHPEAAMFAAQVRLAGTGLLDSAGMLIAADGSSKQRGHREPPAEYSDRAEALLPSGSAALYRRTAIETLGGFDESFFLYCEDTDLGLRARWAGWTCRYVPQAVVEHRYSHSAGAASPLKAYLVERNRLYVVIKSFPLSAMWQVPFAAAWRYLHHAAALVAGRGKGAEFLRAGNPAAMLPWLVLRAHVATLVRLPRLLRARRKVRAQAKLRPAEFRQLLQQHSIPVSQVAAL